MLPSLVISRLQPFHTRQFGPRFSSFASLNSFISFRSIDLPALCAQFKTQTLCFLSLAASFSKTPGGTSSAQERLLAFPSPLRPLPSDQFNPAQQKHPAHCAENRNYAGNHERPNKFSGAAHNESRHRRRRHTRQVPHKILQARPSSRSSRPRQRLRNRPYVRQVQPKRRARHQQERHGKVRPRYRACRQRNSSDHLPHSDHPFSHKRRAPPPGNPPVRSRPRTHGYQRHQHVRQRSDLPHELQGKVPLAHQVIRQPGQQAIEQVVPAKMPETWLRYSPFFAILNRASDRRIASLSHLRSQGAPCSRCN